MCSKVEGHWPRLKWEALEAWPQNRRGWEISGCSSQMGQEELKWTVPGGNLRMFKPNGKRRIEMNNAWEKDHRLFKNRQPHCSHRAGGMLILKKKKKVMICRFQSSWWKLTCWSISQPRPNLISSFPLCTSALCPPCHLQPLNTTLLTVYQPDPHISSLWPGCHAQILHILIRLLSTVLPPLSSVADPKMLTIYNS